MSLKQEKLGIESKSILPFLGGQKIDQVDSETISLFSVEQIREEDTPWKAQAEMSSVNRSIRKASPFKKRLQECKKVRMLYGNINQKALNRYIKEAKRPEDLLLALESRLDVVLKRSALFTSIQSARKSILQGDICVNHTIVRSPGFHCTPGDYVQIIQKSISERFLPAKKKWGDVLEYQNNIHLRDVSETQTDLQSRYRNILVANMPNNLTQSKVVFNKVKEFQDLFSFSELSQLWDKKAGQLYTSALFDFEVTKLLFARSKKSHKTHLADTVASTQLMHDRDLSEQSFLSPYIYSKSDRKMSARFVNIIPTTVEPRLLHKNTIDEKRKINNNIQEDSFFVGEKIEVERPPLRAISSRPLHLEVSYRNLCVIFLYPPQRVCVDISINLSLISE